MEKDRSNSANVQDFQELATFVGERFERVDERFEQLEHKMDVGFGSMNQKMNQLLTTTDGIVKELQAHREEDVFGAAQLRRHDDKIEDHEKRIKTLELQPQE